MSNKRSELYNKYISGVEIRELAKEYGINTARVRQIVIFESNKRLESHSEKEILNSCIESMKDMYKQFNEYSENNEFEFNITYGELVNKLFLSKTTHSGGVDTINKCKQLGVDYSKGIDFK